ncbi:MAG: hypothetical protein IPK07_34510 [Deltaproteobacteria bacterium]|nr:hypothetical protein [Deltaproteobacteria bacterium]
MHTFDLAIAHLAVRGAAHGHLGRQRRAGADRLRNPGLGWNLRLPACDDTRSVHVGTANWLYQKQFESFGHASSAGLSVGIPVSEILVDLGFNADDSGYSQFMKELSQGGVATIAAKSKRSLDSKAINEKVIQAAKECLENDLGLYVQILHSSADPMAFRVKAVFKPDTSGEVVTVRAFEHEPVNLDCGANAFKVDQKIDLAGWEFLCKRASKDAVLISANFDHMVRLGTDHLELPRLKDPDEWKVGPPPPPPTRDYVITVHTGNKEDSQTN